MSRTGNQFLTTTHRGDGNQKRHMRHAQSRIVTVCDTFWHYCDLRMQTGIANRIARNGLSLAARHKRQTFKQVHILLVFQQRAVQPWQVGFAIPPQIFGR